MHARHPQIVLHLCHIWSWWFKNSSRMSVRRWLISCPHPAEVASFSQESSSEFWETHQHGNSCDSAWTWWNCFLFLFSLFLPSSQALCQPVPPVCRALLSNPYVLTSFRGFTEYKRTFRLRNHRHVFSLYGCWWACVLCSLWGHSGVV